MQVEEIYNLLGNKIIESINTDKWTVATLFVDRIEGVVGFTGEYLGKDNNSKNMDIQMDLDSALAVEELHRITTEGGHNRWNKAKFTMTPDHKFEMEFIWDQEYQDEIDQLNRELA